MDKAVAPQPRSGDRASGQPKERLPSIDLLRGLVMAFMALDHARDYFMDVDIEPTDLSHASMGLFLTRWVTHFCAPLFFLLAGMGGYLSSARGKPVGQQARFLLSRGAFLVAIEFTVVRLGWDFNFYYKGGPMLMVLYALGVAMIVLAGLIYLPLKWVATFGVAMIGLHNLLDRWQPEDFGAFAPLWSVLHGIRGPTELAGLPFYVSYPLVPWVGVMAIGYAIGPVMLLEGPKRRRWLWLGGGALTLAFVGLRAWNYYGDSSSWTVEKDTATTVLSFLNTTKYPPSLLFLLMTLGPGLATLAFFESVKVPGASYLINFGRVPLFFYVMHLYFIHAFALALGALQGHSLRSLCVFYAELPAGYGFSLPVVYGLWLLVLVVLYPFCAWFANLKKRSKQAWLSYL